MKTYVIVTQSLKGDRKMIWINAETYNRAKEKFQFDYPDYEAISMWLRVRS